MKNLIKLQLIALALPTVFYSQELPEVIPPSPTVSNLMQFEEVPVSYYTGQPDISLPLFSKQLTGDLSMNIGLSYNTQGIKVDNISGWTGTGWSLIAGGTISRTVRGLPDETSQNLALKSVKGIYHLDIFWDYFDFPQTTQQERTEFNFNVLFGNKDLLNDAYDSKPDLYQFNFMGYSGRFIVIKEGSSLVPKFISKNQKFLLEIFHDSNFEITAFRFTDPKGYIYDFGTVEESLVTQYSLSTSQGQSASLSHNDPGFMVNTAWQLDRVSTGSNTVLVDLYYQDVAVSYQTAPSLTTNTVINCPGCEPITIAPYNQAIMEPQELLSYQNIACMTKKLDRITFPRDNTEIEFNIHPSFTHPEGNGKVLKKISIKNQGIVQKEFELNYQDYMGDPSPSNLDRLWLTNVRETAESVSHDFNLGYYNKEQLPHRSTNYIEEDYWGYYSGIDLKSNGCNLTSYDDDLIKTGLLTLIEYPTGGVKKFEFEHNSFSYYQSTEAPFEDYIANPRNFTHQHISNPNFSHTFTNWDPVTIFGSVTLDFTQDIYLSSNLSGGPNGDLSDHFIKITGTNNAFTYQTSTLNNSCVSVRNVPQGDYIVELGYIGGHIGTYNVSGDFQLKYSTANGPIREEMIGGGVRIKSIKFMDNSLSIEPSREVEYVYQDETDALKSSGVVDSPNDKLVLEYNKILIRALHGGQSTYQEGSCHDFMEREVNYLVKQKSVNIDLTQGGYIGYKHVKVLESGNGKRTFSYTTAADYPNSQSAFDLLEPFPKENLDYKRGLLLEEKTFNEAGQILRETSYLDDNGSPNYEFEEEFVFNDMNHYRPYDCYEIDLMMDYYDYANGIMSVHPCNPSEVIGRLGLSPCGALNPKHTPFNSGWAKLMGKETREFFYDSQNNQSVKTVREEFGYNSANYQLATRDVYYDQKGSEEHISTSYYYPVGTNLGSNTSAVLNKLVACNKVNEVLETVTAKNTVQISEIHNIYGDFDASANDLMLPSEIKVGKGTSAPETRVEFLRYNELGNPTEVKKTGGTPIVYVYGFNGSLPVAKIANGQYGTVQGTLGTGISPTGNLTLSQESNLRGALPNALITFYRYDPLKGLISTCDEKGYQTSYGYDGFDRLVESRDADGNVLARNDYHYILQN